MNHSVYTYNNADLTKLIERCRGNKVGMLNCAYDGAQPFANKKILSCFIRLAQAIKPQCSLHLSTISVLDGKEGAVKILDVASPASYYGRLKLLIDKKLIATKIPGLKILRVPNVLGSGGNWDAFLNRLRSVKTAYLPSSGAKTGVFIQVEHLVDYIATLLRSDKEPFDQPMVLSVPAERCVFATWREIFLMANLQITIVEATNKKYSDSTIKNLILTLLSAKPTVSLLFASRGLSNLAGRFLGGQANASAQLPEILHVDNTVRLTQSVNFVNDAV
ncbi:hypothetical protein BUE76_16950 [Cnuella takakiae]|nr:hypothetical protein BUE76_16950 [Cnuella takakiae]